MLKSSLQLFQAAAPISKAEFLNAISEVCPEALQDGGSKLALAISGGVDSMALATLCRKYLPENGTQLHGIIVDHGVRPTSSDEALKTKQVVESSLNIPCLVRKVAVNLNNVKAFETHARDARFKTIVEEMRPLGIRNVLFAHHRGDQYENELLRLAYSSRSSLSMMPRGPMLHSRVIFPWNQSEDEWKIQFASASQSQGVKGVASLEILVQRPLLGFSKDRLLSTCQHFEIAWIEDETNRDIRLAPRNALRHVLAHHKLPAALSEDNLSRLAHNKYDQNKAIHDVSQQLFALTSIKLDVRVGAAMISVPRLDDVVKAFPKLAKSFRTLSSDMLPKMFKNYLCYVEQVVGPFLGGHRASRSVESMPHFFNNHEDRKPFTYRSVSFTPQSDGRWLITSAPVYQSRITRRQALITMYIAPNQTSFLYFDQRWHIKVKNPSTSEELTVQYLQQDHLNRLQLRLRSGEVSIVNVMDASKTPRNLDAIFNSFWTHSQRFLLPIITMRSIANPEDETVLAFPTLNLRTHSSAGGEETVPSWIEDLEWEVYYKHVDQMEGRLETCVVQPTSKESRGLV